MEYLFLHGSGFLFFWYIGLLNSLEKNILDNYNFYCYSGGALGVVFYLCNISTKEIIEYFKKYDNLCLNFLLDNLDKILDDLLPINCHEICNDKVTILYRQLFLELKTVNKFKNKKQLIEYLTISCRLPFTVKNVKNIYYDYSFDPVYVNPKNIINEKDSFVDIKITYDENISKLWYFYIFENHDDYLKIDTFGYNYGKNNIIVKNNLFNLKCD